MPTIDFLKDNGWEFFFCKHCAHKIKRCLHNTLYLISELDGSRCNSFYWHAGSISIEIEAYWSSQKGMWKLTNDSRRRILKEIAYSVDDDK